MSNTNIAPPKPALDWKHIAFGLAGVLLPVIYKYATGLDWSSLGGVWGLAIPGALNALNEVLTTQIKALS